MIKIKIYGIGNEGNFNHYTIEKTREAQEALGSLFKEIFDIEWPSEVEIGGNNNVPELKKINIEEYNDFHEIIGGWKTMGQNRIDIFYGHKKMFIIINCVLKKRKEFHNELKKISKFVEIKNENSEK